jgi:tetraacyldisaccharide 4'-kinase
MEAAAKARGLPVFHASLEPDPDAAASLRAKKVLAFAGIGHPEKFFATLSAAGIDAPVRRGFGDHHRYSVAEARSLMRDADKDSLELVTTEKDLARLKDDAAVAPLAGRARALPVTLCVAEAEGFARLVRTALAKD